MSKYLQADSMGPWFAASDLYQHFFYFPKYVWPKPCLPRPPVLFPRVRGSKVHEAAGENGALLQDNSGSITKEKPLGTSGRRHFLQQKQRSHWSPPNHLSPDMQGYGAESILGSETEIKDSSELEDEASMKDETEKWEDRRRRKEGNCEPG